jgi:hypothetical protein
MTAALVTTTIYVPELLDTYMENAIDHGHADTLFIVAGDRKTPAEAKSWCLERAGERGVAFEFLDCDDQQQYLARYPELDEHLPYNSIQRRNIAILLAYERGCDPIITIDDDNLFLRGDFVGEHSLAGRRTTIEAFTSSSGWFDVCQHLEEARGVPFYHRGFPPGERWGDQRSDSQQVEGRVAVNAGLWLGDPDVDALQRLVYPVEATGWSRTSNFALSRGTWSPFNSQNTALARDVVPAYFLSPKIGRFDDIWASYVVRAITDHLGDYVSYGVPLVRQERNPHDYWRDLDQEREPMRLTDRLCAALREIELRSSDYGACFGEIWQGLLAWLEREDGLRPPERTLLQDYLEGFGVWQATIARA